MREGERGMESQKIKMRGLRPRRSIQLLILIAGIFVVIMLMKKTTIMARQHEDDNRMLRLLDAQEAEARKDGSHRAPAPAPLVKPDAANDKTSEDVSNIQEWGKDLDPETYFRGSNIPDDVLAMKPPHYLKNYKNPCWYEVKSGQDGGRKLRCLPYFHLIGVDKSGTTDLWFRMIHHPNIVQPRAVLGKETHWWSWRRFGFDIWVKEQPIRHFDWYLSSFDSPAEKIEKKVEEKGSQIYHPIITGEGSPTVFWDFTGWNLIPQNSDRTPETALLTPHCIKHLTPEAKFIVIFRNPTDRMYSDYVFLDRFRSFHNVSLPGFHQEVKRSIDMLNHCFDQKSHTACLYDKELHMRIPVRLIVGMYDVFLKEWLKVFPSNQILVMRNEDYSKSIAAHLKALFNFLELPPLSDTELERIANLPRAFETSLTKKLGPMMPETRALLNKFYSNYNKQLADRFNDPKYLWQD